MSATVPTWSTDDAPGREAHLDLRWPAGTGPALAETAARLGVDPDVLVATALDVVALALAEGAHVDPATRWRSLVERQQPPDPRSPLRVHADVGGLVLSHRTDHLDADAASRVGRYLLRALAHLVADPDAAPPAPADLVDEAELALLVHGLAGPRRAIPATGLHRLVEEQVAAHPDRVAVRCGRRRLTYAELDSRANRVARSLLAAGLRREGVVAVVCDRDLDWPVCLLAVLKAGGAYLPVEPHFPRERVSRMLRRSGATHLLTESAATGPDAETASGVVRIEVDRAVREEPRDDVLDLDVTPDQLAYLYFTSGSTGEPKGAMCEHAGMLNHLLAKREDLGIVDGDVVAQVAPQCFDISLWQLVSALLVGGTTEIVPDDVVLDAERMVDRLAGSRVGVLQVVPSYLEALLTYLERHPRALPDLRVVSVTGEAVKQELVQRFFAAAPDLALVNAYGLTETCDDTNHAVLTAPPPGDRVPLGPAVRNVHVYVVDADLRPVPLGAPGEIVFSGVCVGRGYVNDPERTAAAFLPDPLRPGERLYRSGDFGRWRPGGSLEFLGRRDSQLKIAGHRIEIGEIENALLRVPGVRDGAVVVLERADGSRHLVGFAAGDAAPEPEVLRRELGRTLPGYMVPGTVHRRDRLPLSDNGKVDRRRLGDLAAELAASTTAPGAPASRTGETGPPAPATEAERKVAAAWARALSVPADSIAVTDHFFERGGTSLSAVKVVVGLDRAITLRQIVDHPVLGDLARQLAPSS